MTPQSFDIDTAKEIVGDTQMRVIEAKARQDADNGVKDIPTLPAGGSYWDRVVLSMEMVVYDATYRKRLERVKRMKERAREHPTSNT